MPKIAKGFDSLAIKLSQHVYYYTPKNWCENIGKVISLFHWSADEIKVLFDCHEKGDISKGMSEFVESLSKHDPAVQYPVVRDGILDFFKENPNIIEDQKMWDEEVEKLCQTN